MTKSDEFRRAAAYTKALSRISLSAGANSVVDNNRLPRMSSDSKIVMTDDVYQTLKIVGEVTNETGAEVPFLLFGHSEGQSVFFDRVIADRSGSNNGTEAVFTEAQERELVSFCRAAEKSENKIIAHGHSHPRIGPGYLNYSLGDINAYIGLREDNEFIKNNVDVCGCLVTGGNYNFVFFDGNDTYRFDNVFVSDKNGKMMRLQAFGPDVMSQQYGRSNNARR